MTFPKEQITASPPSAGFIKGRCHLKRSLSASAGGAGGRDELSCGGTVGVCFQGSALVLQDFTVPLFGFAGLQRFVCSFLCKHTSPHGDSFVPLDFFEALSIPLSSLFSWVFFQTHNKN